VPYEPSPLVEIAWKRHPRCLAEVNARPLRVPPEGARAFNDFAYFAVLCPCGSKHWRVLGYPHPEAVFLCPLSVECAECLRVASIFDVAIHGYDAELALGCFSMRGEGEPSQLACPHCAGHIFEVLPNFSYQLDPAELAEEELSRVQDLFDVFGLDTRCRNCGALESPVGYECA
jgi:hypothetical protein